MLDKDVFFVLGMLITACAATHFYGGTISWRVLGPASSLKVEFFWRQGWRRDKGVCGSSSVPCTHAHINTYKSNIMRANWDCVSGCGSSAVPLSPLGYYVTAVNIPENWEQGTNSFSYTFASRSKYHIAFRGRGWLKKLNYTGGDQPWSVLTKLDLSIRSDTGKPNASPLTSSKPIYRLAHGRSHRIDFPVVDPDFDVVRCRWAQNTSSADECGGVCNALPPYHLDKNTCVLSFDATIANLYYPYGWYAAALQIEDFPLTTITFGSSTKTPNDSLSSVPLQFLIYTPILPQGSHPVFISPTPTKDSVFYIPENDTFTAVLQATNTNTSIAIITDISLIGPFGITRTPLTNISFGEQSFIAVSWTPKLNQYGIHLLCIVAENSLGLSTVDYCFILRAGESSPCGTGLNPCQYGSCDDSTGRAVCSCILGYTGVYCSQPLVQSTKVPSNQKPNYMVIAVLVAGGVVLLAAIIIGVMCCCCPGGLLRKRKKEDEDEVEQDLKFGNRRQELNWHSNGTAFNLSHAESQGVHVSVLSSPPDVYAGKGRLHHEKIMKREKKSKLYY